MYKYKGLYFNISQKDQCFSSYGKTLPTTLYEAKFGFPRSPRTVKTTPPLLHDAHLVYIVYKEHLGLLSIRHTTSCSRDLSYKYSLSGRNRYLPKPGGTVVPSENNTACGRFWEVT